MDKFPVRQLIHFSNYSLCITLPKEFADSLSWKQGDQISFELDSPNKKITMTKKIQPSPNPKPLLPPTPPPKLRLNQPESPTPPQLSKPQPPQPLVTPTPLINQSEDLEPIPQID